MIVTEEYESEVSDDFNDLYNDTSKYERGTRSRWETKKDYFLYTAIQSFAICEIEAFFGTRYDIFGLEYTICIIFLGLPVMYMEVLLGQYTQMSCLFLRNMCPIGHGIGYASLVMILLRTISNGVIIGDNFLYLINTIRKTPPWTACTTSGCWNGSVCEGTTPCLDGETIMSSRIYWNNTFMYGIRDPPKFYQPHLKRFFITCIIWLILQVFLLARKGYQSILSRYILIISMIFLLLNCLVLGFFCEKSYTALPVMFKHSTLEDLISVQTWVDAASNMIIIMNLGKGTHILYASFLPPTNLSAIICVSAMIMFFTIVVTYKVLFYLALNCIMRSANVDDYKSFIDPQEVLTLTVIPFSLGECMFSHLWMLLYFTANILAFSIFVVASLKYVDQSIGDIYGTWFTSYRKYVISINTIVFCVIAFLYTGEGTHLDSFIYLEEVLSIYEILITFLLTTIVCWVYDLRKFSDDIQFIYGSPPLKFWKVCWCLSPIFIGAVFCIKMYNSYHSKNVRFIFVYLFVLSLPIIIGAIYEMFIFMSKRHLRGVFLSVDRWGPPGAILHEARKVYNPRIEIKASKQMYTCGHKCLVDSAVLRKITEEEGRIRSGDTMSHLSVKSSATNSF